MATIAPTDLRTATSLVETTLDGTNDTFVLPTNLDGVLLQFRNPTGSPITPTIVGADNSAAFPIDGVGTIDLTSAYSLEEVAANDAETTVLQIRDIRNRLNGAITIGSGTGLVASLLLPNG